MANEARVQLSLQINGPTNQRIQTQPQSFTADVSRDGGPCPGEFLATKLGTDVNLSGLASPGLCWIFNLGVDANGNNLSGPPGNEYTWTNYIEYGIYDHSTNHFYPLGEALPGEFFIVRLSRFINSEIGTGSGTSPVGGANATFRVKSIGTASKVVIQGYER